MADYVNRAQRYEKYLECANFEPRKCHKNEKMLATLRSRALKEEAGNEIAG